MDPFSYSCFTFVLLYRLVCSFPLLGMAQLLALFCVMCPCVFVFTFPYGVLWCLGSGVELGYTDS